MYPIFFFYLSPLLILMSNSQDYNLIYFLLIILPSFFFCLFFGVFKTEKKFFYENKIKIGIWGLSEHTQKNIIPAILKNKKYSLDKIYSRSKNKNYSKISITNNLNIFLNKCNLDLIYVCLPVSLHYQAVLKCLNSNLNVICEKPLTNKYNDFKKLKALAKSKKLIILESLMYQYHPSLKEIKKLIKKNKYELLEIDFLIPKLKRNNF